MKQIRQNVFETNSSSTHSICIAKDVPLEIPKGLHFSFGEFGWECDTLYSLREKAAYLYTALYGEKRQSDIDKVIEQVTAKGVAVTKEEPIFSEGYTYADNAGYVDHGDELKEFLDAVTTDEQKLMNYLFSELSFIITGNDNDENDVDINVEYAHDEFYKGN